jgi:uncharacterized small protein (DUF1192 family)
METDMIDDDDAAQPRRPARLTRLVLDSLGIEELNAYIAELREEIVRTEAEIARKQSHRSAADTFFRTQ